MRENSLFFLQILCSLQSRWQGRLCLLVKTFLDSGLQERRILSVKVQQERFWAALITTWCRYVCAGREDESMVMN